MPFCECGAWFRVTGYVLCPKCDFQKMMRERYPIRIVSDDPAAPAIHRWQDAL